MNGVFVIFATCVDVLTVVALLGQNFLACPTRARMMASASTHWEGMSTSAYANPGPLALTVKPVSDIHLTRCFHYM
jgi:hypothetical protein